MRPQRIALALALGALGLARFAPARAQEEAPKAAAEESATPKATAPDGPASTRAEGDASPSLRALNESYEKRRAEFDRQMMADLADLAARLKGTEADLAYHQLFNMAIARDQYEPAAQAADAYLAGDGRDAELRGLAAFIGAVHKANHDQYPQALAALDRFLKGQTAEKKLDPNTIFAVGEAFLQRLIHAGRYDVARQACNLVLRDDPDPAVKAHFAARLTRLGLLGKPAPPIDASDVDGNPVRLADLKGKVVLVDFWATWCPPCVAQMPTYRAAYDKHHADGFEILGVNLDAARQNPDAARPDAREIAQARQGVRQFLLQFRIPWPNVLNGATATDFARVYGVTDLPTSFLIDRAGKVIQVEPGGPELEKTIEEALGEPGAKQEKD